MDLVNIRLCECFILAILKEEIVSNETLHKNIDLKRSNFQYTLTNAVLYQITTIFAAQVLVIFRTN